MLPTALIYQLTATKVLMQSDIPLREGGQSGLMSFKHTTLRYQSTKFASPCRLYYRSHGIEIFSDLWSSLIVFGNILENKITLTKVVSLELKIFAPKPEVCEMDENVLLQNGLTLLSRIWTSRSKTKKAHKIILTWCLRRFSKSAVFGNVFFRIAIKIHLEGNFDFFSVFSLMEHIIHFCSKTCLKCV